MFRVKTKHVTIDSLTCNLAMYTYMYLYLLQHELQLCGVITHIGASFNGGHWIAYVLQDTWRNSSWWKYNDSAAYDTMRSDLPHGYDNIQSDACLLFYRNKGQLTCNPHNASPMVAAVLREMKSLKISVHTLVSNVIEIAVNVRRLTTGNSSTKLQVYF